MKRKPNVLVPIGSVREAPTHDGDVRVLARRWWVVEDDHLVFYRGRAPQCNSDIRIVEGLAGLNPGSTVRFIEQAYIPVRPDIDGVMDYAPLLVEGAFKKEEALDG